MSGERLHHDPDFKTALNNLGERGEGRAQDLGLLNLMKTLLPCHRVPFGLTKFDTGIQFRRWPQAHPCSATPEKPACI